MNGLLCIVNVTNVPVVGVYEGALSGTLAACSQPTIPTARITDALTSCLWAWFEFGSKRMLVVSAFIRQGDVQVEMVSLTQNIVVVCFKASVLWTGLLEDREPLVAGRVGVLAMIILIRVREYVVRSWDGLIWLMMSGCSG